MQALLLEDENSRHMCAYIISFQSHLNSCYRVSFF